jgi:hypothetical protein
LGWDSLRGRGDHWCRSRSRSRHGNDDRGWNDDRGRYRHCYRRWSHNRGRISLGDPRCLDRLYNRLVIAVAFSIIAVIGRRAATSDNLVGFRVSYYELSDLLSQH